jgi:hypothetical protein
MGFASFLSSERFFDLARFFTKRTLITLLKLSRARQDASLRLQPSFMIDEAVELCANLFLNTQSNQTI